MIESWMTTSLPLSAAKGLPLSGAKGADDGGRPEVGSTQTSRESGMANRKQALRAQLAYLTSQWARRRVQEGAKRGDFRGKQSH